MALKITGTVEVKDNNGQNHTIDANDMGFEVVSTDEDPMGTRRFYEGSYEFDDLSITIRVTEYPEGAYETHEFDYKKDRLQLINDNLEFGYDE